MSEVVGVILAAGKGVRMYSDLPKVLHPVAGIPMGGHVIKAAREAGVKSLVLVVGHGSEMVMEGLANYHAEFAFQEEQLGTGHALLQAEEEAKAADIVLVLCGDTPLLRPGVLKDLIAYHSKNQPAATVLTAVLKEPRGYGRVLRNQEGELIRIVEEKDATFEERQINEINSGIYCFHKQVFAELKTISPENAQGEYYLTDVISKLRAKGERVLALSAAEEQEIYGINDRVQLAYAEKILRRRKCEQLMRAGVTILDPDSTFIDTEVIVGKDSVIYPFAFIEGETIIGTRCHIGPGTRITDSKVGNQVSIESSKVMDSIIGDSCNIGPFSYLRPGTVLDPEVKIGDFVEIKKSTIGTGSKVPHLSYVGDATIGTNVNIGAGTITCNYDGESKYPTIIEDGVFIGSNTNLVAPVKIGQRATTGAGSTITQDLPPFSLGVERAPQKVISNWKKRKTSKESE